MSKTHSDQRRYRRKAWSTDRGIKDHRKREKRRKKSRWQKEQYLTVPQ